MTTALDPDSAAGEPPALPPYYALAHHEHLLTTHFAVIEGWLGLLEDGLLDDAERRHAAKVLRERTGVLRTDVVEFLTLVKRNSNPADQESGTA